LREWQAKVQQRLRELNKPQSWLAKRIGASAATVTGILRARIGTSKYIEPISEVLHIPPPYRLTEVAGKYPYAGTGQPESCEKLALALAVLAMRKTVGELADALDEYATCVVEGDNERAENESCWPVRDLVERINKDLKALDKHHTEWATLPPLRERVR
jgi:hypothetical protein